MISTVDRIALVKTLQGRGFILLFTGAGFFRACSKSQNTAVSLFHGPYTILNFYRQVNCEESCGAYVVLEAPSMQ